MATQQKPKVLLFDIGGVCVVSPFQTILDYELSLGIPPGWINYSISKTSPNGFWHQLERGHIPMDAGFFAGFNKDLRDPERWKTFYGNARGRNPERYPGTTVPPVPEVDGERMFHEMMKASNSPDPWMYPALQALKEDGRFVLAALSNTVIFPEGHELHHEDPTNHPVKRLFDVFVSSAHVGLRKPEPAMYDLAVQEVDKWAKTHADTERAKKAGNSWADGVKPEDILFLDDIGENLKAAKKHGFRTIKVHLGRTYEAVDELEAATGLQLAGSHPRPVQRARI